MYTARGFTLLELTLVIAIMLVLFSSVTIGYTDLLETNRLHTVADQLSHHLQNAKFAARYNQTSSAEVRFHPEQNYTLVLPGTEEQIISIPRNFTLNLEPPTDSIKFAAGLGTTEPRTLTLTSRAGEKEEIIISSSSLIIKE